MAPLVRRTWAVRGETPALHQRGRHREKVSLAAALWLNPARDRLRLFWRSLVDSYYNNERIAKFLQSMLRAIRHPLVVVWDRGNMHKGPPIRAAVERFGSRLRLEALPSYAPMLNPMEQLFGWLKYGVLSNYAPADALELNRRVTKELNAIKDDDPFLRRLWSHSETPLPKPRFRGHYFSDDQ